MQTRISSKPTNHHNRTFFGIRRVTANHNQTLVRR
jgi:hypothetical protein